MKKFRKKGLMSPRRLIGNLLSQRRIIPILAVAAGLLPATGAYGTEINLVTPYPGSGSFPGVVPGVPGGDPTFPGPGGSGAIYSTIDSSDPQIA